MDIEEFRSLALWGARLIHQRPKEAERLLLKALDIYEAGPAPDDAALRKELWWLRDQVVRHLASLAVDSGDHDAAIRHFLRLAERESDGTEALFELVRAAAAAGRHGEARRFYRRYVARMETIPATPAPFPGPGRL